MGHTEGEAVKENEVAATCLSAGSYEEVICCAVCGEEMSRKTVTVDALGHDYKGVVTDEALCLVPGEMTYTCTRCDDSYTEEIAPLRHSWGETKPGLAPTCTSAGYTSYETCTRCGYSNRETIPATGHTWGDWQETTAATCITAGVEEHTCSVCGAEETKTIAVDPTAHKADETDYIADEKGHWFACSVCGTELKDETYEEHDYTGGEQNCTICGVTDSTYFYFTLLDDGSSYGIEQTITVLSSPPYYYFSNFTGSVKLPDYHNGFPITELMEIRETPIEIELPSGPVTDYLETGAFFNNTSLTNIELPNFITEIPDQAFYGCTALESVSIPDGVTSIGYYAFRDCTLLENINIPDRVTSIGSYAFSRCALKEIEIPDSVTSIGDFAFEYCEEIVSIDISNVFSIGEGIFRDCTALESVTLPDDITTIVRSMFWNCTSLIFEIPDTVTTIGDQAFIGCSFTSITIPDGVTSIGGSTFADCTSLTSITIPNRVTSIGDWAFRDCTSLTSITIPNSVKEIEDRAFWGCTSLTSITIPESVTLIGDYAFEDCDNLTSVEFADTTSEWGMKRYSDSVDFIDTFTPSTPEENAKALTDTYLRYIWEKQTND